MGVVIKGSEELAKTLSLLGGDVAMAGRYALRRGAILMAETAQKYAPLEYGPLEESIKVAKEEHLGVNSWKNTVFVDVATPAPQRKRKGRAVTVGDYATYVENNIPRGVGRGEQSVAKAARLGVKVGPRFMSRAFRDTKPEIQADVESSIAAALARRQLGGTAVKPKTTSRATSATTTRRRATTPVVVKAPAKAKRAPPKKAPVRTAKAKVTPRKAPAVKRPRRVQPKRKPRTRG